MPNRQNDRRHQEAAQRCADPAVVPQRPPQDASESSGSNDAGSDNATVARSPAAGSAVRQLNSPPTATVVWLKKADQVLLGTLLLVLLTLLIAFRLKLSGWGQSEIEIIDQLPREFVYRIDINTASWVEWAQLDGIGEKLGRRIIQDRTDHGPFRSIDDVGRVRGIGPKLIEKIAPHLKCPDCESEPAPDPPN